MLCNGNMGNIDDVQHPGSASRRLWGTVLVIVLVLYWPDLHRAVLGRDVVDGSYCGRAVSLGVSRTWKEMSGRLLTACQVRVRSKELPEAPELSLWYVFSCKVSTHLTLL